VLDFAYTVRHTHKRCKNRPLNRWKVSNAVSIKRIFEVTAQNFPRKIENNHEFEKKIRKKTDLLCWEKIRKKTISSFAKKIRKKTNLLLCSPNKQGSWALSPQKATPLFVHLWSWSEKIESYPVLIYKISKNHQYDPVLIRPSKTMYFYFASWGKKHCWSYLAFS